MSSNPVSRIIRYFKECYQSDTRSFQLNNFFSSQVKSGRIISGTDDILNSRIGRHPLSDKYGQSVEKDLLLHRKEKGIYLFSFFVTGSDTESFGQKQKLCAPVFIHPARVTKEADLYYLDIDFDNTFLNQNFLSKLITGSDNGFYKAIDEAFRAGKLDFAAIGQIKRVFESFTSDLNCEELLHYPELLKTKDIRAHMEEDYDNQDESFRILPAVGYGIMKKSDQTRGILEELDLLTERPDEHSIVIGTLFSGESKVGETINFDTLPEKLSRAQNEVLKSVSKHRITQVTGPPGTGKSYTIASLTAGLIAEGKSVLITAKTDEAVNVVSEKLTSEYDLGKLIVSSSSGRYRMKLSSYLRNRLNNVNSVVDFGSLESAYKSEKRYEHLRKSLELSSMEMSERLLKEMEMGEYLSRDESGIFHAIKRIYLQWKIDMDIPYWKLTETLFEKIDKVDKEFRKLLLLRYNVTSINSIQKNRGEYVNFRSGLNAKTDGERERFNLKVDFNEILKSIPVWLCKANSISKVLPMRREMFDVAIVDEASQCDIATMLPIMQRAKRLVVVGDPHQLRHVSFVSASFAYDLLHKYNLPDLEYEQCFNYRKLSILDLVNNKIKDGRQIVFLNEHYRSNPDIISFSNKEFYENSLVLMTDHPSRRDIKSTRFIRTGGKRDHRGVNEIEAKNLIGKLKLLINTAESNEEPLIRSIGILSPFRAQVDYLSALLTDTFTGAIINKYSISCGTAYSFQGEERDIMFLSMCVDADSHPTAFMHLNKPDIFNVSITRAKHKQFVFLSVDENDLKPSVFRDFLNNVWHSAEKYNAPELNERFVKEVIDTLSEYGIESMASFPIAGRKIDILCKNGSGYFGINLIGYPGEYETGHDVEELKLLYRSGMKVFPLPYSYWYFEKENCIREIILFAENSG